MSNPTSIFPSWESESKQTADPNKGRRKILMAAFVSAIFPGLGQCLVGRRRTGMALLILAFALFSLCWPLRFLTHMEGLLIFGTGMLTLCIFATINAAYGGRARTIRPSQWWLAVLLPFAFGMAVAHVNWGSPGAGVQTILMPSPSMEKNLPDGSPTFGETWDYK